MTAWELENLHLPPVATITLYEGDAPIEYLRRRLALMLTKNPWLTARIVKKSSADGVVALAYEKTLAPERVTDQHLSLYAPGQVELSLGMPFEDLVHSLLPVQCARSRPATDADEVLFKVAVVPIEAGGADDSQATALGRAITGPGFALVVSMNHSLGDGHTYYKLYAMLSTDVEVEALDPVRVPAFEEAKSAVIGDEESAMFASTGLSLGIVGTYAAAKATRRDPQSVCVNEVDLACVAQEKANAKQEGQEPFVSTNDALTSWYFREMKSDLNIMVANFRGREPSILDLTDHHVGNYEANVPYFPGDVESPTLIRQSIRGADGGFRARRAGSPPTMIPGFSTLVRNKTSIITNWATFYRDVRLGDNVDGDEDSTHTPTLHLPIMESDGMIMSVWNSAVVFRPRAGALGMLLVTRRFDSDKLAQLKAQVGPDAPLGARIV